jgi:hypothetical protein
MSVLLRKFSCPQRLEIVPPPSVEETRNALLDMIIADVGIYEKSIYLHYVNNGNYKIIAGVVYIGDGINEDFNPPNHEAYDYDESFHKIV